MKTKRNYQTIRLYRQLGVDVYGTVPIDGGTMSKIVGARFGDVELLIDLDAMQHMARKALRAKTGRAASMHGAIVCRVLKDSHYETKIDPKTGEGVWTVEEVKRKLPSIHGTLNGLPVVFYVSGRQLPFAQVYAGLTLKDGKWHSAEAGTAAEYAWETLVNILNEKKEIHL
jgi:hypothetical protein